MPRARKQPPIQEPPQSARQQVDRLIEAVQSVASEIEALRNAVDDVAVELQWHMRNFKDHVRCLTDVLESTHPATVLHSPDPEESWTEERGDDQSEESPQPPGSPPRSQQRDFWAESQE